MAAKKSSTKKQAPKAAAKEPRTKKASAEAETAVAGERTAKTAETKPKRQAKKAKGDKKLSALDAAAKVLSETGEPMTCREMIEAMAAKGYWTSPGGQTPSATLYSSILRELQQKGKDARFRKTDRGKFASADAK